MYDEGLRADCDDVSGPLGLIVGRHVLCGDLVQFGDLATKLSKIKYI
jgi:hypothetical protein